MNAYLFDLDGTLIDSFEDIAISLNVALKGVGLPERPTRDLYQYIGEGAQRLIERAFGASYADRVSQGLDIWREHYDRHLLDHTRVYAGIFEALASLPGMRAVVTNKPGPSARRLIEGFGLSQLVPVVVGGGDVFTRKPDPAGVLQALKQLPEAGKAVFIGDSVVDAQTARAANIAFVGVLWGPGNRQDLEAAGARIFARQPQELNSACAQAILETR